MRKLILISAIVALVAGSSSLLASPGYQNNNKDDLDEHYEAPYGHNKNGLDANNDEYDERYEITDSDNLDEHYEISNIYNGKEHYANHDSNDEYDEHF